MRNDSSDNVFAGTIPELYDSYLVPLIFESYAADLAARLAARPLTRVLEIAAGTGVVTRAMATALPETVSIVATDLHQSMLDRAAARHHAAGHVAPGGCEGTALSRRCLRRGRMPIRRHVLP